MIEPVVTYSWLRTDGQRIAGLRLRRVGAASVHESTTVARGTAPLELADDCSGMPRRTRGGGQKVGLAALTPTLGRGVSAVLGGGIG